MRMRDHGGNIDEAHQMYGEGDWLDLSTAINRVSYPIPPLPNAAWTDLPTRAAQSRLLAAASKTYRTAAPLAAFAGAQSAIQLIPRLTHPGHARVLAPTYNEHAAQLRAQGWQVEEVPDIKLLRGADLAIITNPNNPDGRRHTPADLLALQLHVGLLVVDESFADPTPELSLTPLADRSGLVVLRSFGKFYGLAGLRLGFAIGGSEIIARLSEMAGPWPVSGAAIAIGEAAHSDGRWISQTISRLRRDAVELDKLASMAGWQLAGGTELFRLYFTDNAAIAQQRLALHQIWSRTFPYSGHWIRLGLPGKSCEWTRLRAALGQ
jgi:cobalamin biosynthesis protein CobC